VVYAAYYIFLSSFVVDGTRYFVLFDDAMISMRYALNLVRGNGLVWNPGELVEGFTNPLWTLFMAVFHLLPLDPSKISLPIQIVGGLFFIASLYFVKKIADELLDNQWVSLLAVLMTAFYGQLSTWSLLGMEVSVLILITMITVWLSLRALKSNKFNPWIYVLLGVGTLVRIDMAVIYLAVVIFLIVADKDHRKRHLVWGVLTFIVFIGGQTLIRYLYYGEIFPNTYYLKVTGAPTLLIWKRGLFVFAKFVWNFNTLIFILPFLVILIKPSRYTLLLAWVFASMCAYSIYIGGDAWEAKGGANRFISTVIPLYFVLLSYSLEMIRRGLMTVLDQKSDKVNLLTKVGMVAIVVVSMVNFNALLDTSSLKFWLLLKRHQFIPGSERYVEISSELNKITTDEASIAVVTAGIIPYFTDTYALDLMGKTDPIVALGDMHITEGLPLIDLRPGHMKWDYAYSLGERKPDVVAQLWDGYSNPNTLQYLTEYTKVTINNFPFFLKNSSPNVLWDKLPEQ
jgi:hypothetical protein